MPLASLDGGAITAAAFAAVIVAYPIAWGVAFACRRRTLLAATAVLMPRGFSVRVPRPVSEMREDEPETAGRAEP